MTNRARKIAAAMVAALAIMVSFGAIAEANHGKKKPIRCFETPQGKTCVYQNGGSLSLG